MLISYARGQGSIILRVKILDSSATTGAGLTGLTFNSAGLIISTVADNEASGTAYTQAGGTIEAVAAPGTYAAPTAGKCRFGEPDATNHPGVYEIHLADARYAVASAKSLLVSISGAANCAETDAVIPLRDLDPYDVVRAGLTALPAAAADAAGGLPVSDVGGLDLDTLLARLDAAITTRSSHTAAAAGTDAAAKVLATPAQLLVTDAGGSAAANLVSILGTALTETGGYIAAAFKKLFNVASPVFTAESPNVPSATLADYKAMGFSTHSAADAGTDAAGKVLATPAQLLVTDASGHVTLANGAHGGAAASLTLADYANFHATAANIRAAIGLAAANLDTQFADLPTVAEFNARTLMTAAYFDPAEDEVVTDAASREASKATGFNTTTPPTVMAISDQVWDETNADHVAAGSTGKNLTDAGATNPTAAAIADAVWDEEKADHVTSGTFGGIFAGLTRIADWFASLMGKTADATTLAEIQARTAGTSYTGVTDSNQAIRDAITATGAVGTIVNAETNEVTVNRYNDYKEDSTNGRLPFTLTGYDLTGVQEIWFTVKRSYDDADADAELALTKTDGDIAVTGAATGDIAVSIDAAELDLAAPPDYVYDIKVKLDDTVTTPVVGDFTVADVATRATS